MQGVKVDFWHSDKQDRIRQYRDVLQDAADFGLLVDFHGCTVPRGWSREFPNLVTMEGVFGAEQYKFRDEYSARAAWHNTVLPFTRNAVGPMDFTPVTFQRHEISAQDDECARARAVGGLRVRNPALRRQRRCVPGAARRTEDLSETGAGSVGRDACVGRRARSIDSRGEAWPRRMVRRRPERRGRAAAGPCRARFSSERIVDAHPHPRRRLGSHV